MKLFATFDPSLSAEVVDCPSAPSAVVAVVLQHSGGELGFDRSGGAVVMRHLSRSCEIGIVGQNQPTWVARSNDWDQTFILPNASPGVVTVEAPAPEVFEQLRVTDADARKRQANLILARHDRPLQPLVGSTFDDWITDDRKVSCSALQWLLSHSSIVALWRHSDWGVHTVVYSFDVELLRARLKEVASLCGCGFTEVSSTLEMPAW